MKILFLCALGFWLGSTPAQAKTPEEIRGAIQNEIRQRHPNPPPNFWNNLGLEALPVIKQMYRTSEDVNEKSWLVGGMSFFDDPETTQLLKSEITSGDDEVLKKKMLAALMQSQGDSEYDFVEPYLKDEDAHIRMAVAQGLKNMSSDRARKRLEAFYQQERLAWVKEGVQKSKTEDVMKIKRADDRVSDSKKEIMVVPVPTPMPEKDWAGEWKGVYVTPSKTGPTNVFLTYNPKPTTALPKWKVELRQPKRAKQELSEKDFDIVYYQTATSHWLEVRNKKADSVFIGQKGKTKP